MTRATLGLTFQARNGFFAGAGVSWNVPTRARTGSFTDEPDVIGDYYDMQFRIGYHPGVRVYAPPPPPAAGAGGHPAAAEPAADRARALRTVHGGNRQDVDGDRRRAGSGRRHVDLPLDRRQPGRFANAGRPADAVDGADAGRGGSGDGHRRRRQGRHGVGLGHHPGDPAACGRGAQFRRRLLRLRPIHASSRSAASARRRGGASCRRTPTRTSSSRGTRAASAPPNTTWRSATGAPTACKQYLMSRGVAGQPSRDAQLRRGSSRSSTTRAKKRAG